MPCPPFLAEARQGALQTLAKRRRRIPLSARCGEQRLGIEPAEPAQHLARGRRRSCSMAASSGVRASTASGGAVARSSRLRARDLRSVRHSYAAMPRAHGSASRRASNSAARANTLTSADCAASSASAGTVSARAANARRTGHKAEKTGSKASRSPSARRHIPRWSAARAPWSNSPPERTPRAVLAARRDRAAARRRRPCPHRGRGQGERQEGPDHPAPHLASFSGCSLAASTGIGRRRAGRDTPRDSMCPPARTCARGRGPMRLLLLAMLCAADAGVWSPDGRWIAYTSEVYPGCAGEAAAVDACDKKHFEERKASKVEARTVDHLCARHWTEWKDGKRTHVFVQPAQGGPARDLTPGDSDRPTFRLGGGDDIGFTPDGAQVLVSAKPAQREAWSTNGDLWAIPVQGGAPRNLTAGNPGDDASPKPSPDGRWLAWLAQARNGYESDQWKLMLMDRRSGMVSVIGDFGDDVSLEGKVARYADSPASSDFALAPDGSGGPQGAWEDEWGMRWNEAAFAARGYVVLAVNPRGSTGFGRAFVEQISGDWGGLAYDDLMRAVDAAEKLPYVLPGHTCAAGASFGGYMIDWIAGHTDRFKCLVSHDGVYDLAAGYGSTEELWFPEWEMRGTPWDNPEAYRKWSPSTYAQNFKTPTLVVQGELDFRVPVEQGMGMFTALQRRGVESRLLYFPDEGHWVTKPRNSQVWYHTVLDWIDAHAALGGAHPALGGAHPALGGAHPAA